MEIVSKINENKKYARVIGVKVQTFLELSTVQNRSDSEFKAYDDFDGWCEWSGSIDQHIV